MIHHITAISSNAQRTSDFYTQVLGLRLVKVTVNQDDVGTYHIYFGDKTGRPGTALTFFPWETLPKGKPGQGMVSAVAFAVSRNSLKFWEERFKKLGIKFDRKRRFSKDLIAFSDPDGLNLEIFESNVKFSNWTIKGILREHAINGFYGASLILESYEGTADLLKKHLDYTHLKSEGNWHRYSSKTTIIDIHEAPDASPGIQGGGTVHHIAFRAKDKEMQKVMREKLIADGLRVTPFIDRYYFNSVYFREPGNVLFEIATDEPGFTVDEPEELLGTKLVLPPKFEKLRGEIEKILPGFKFPQVKNG